MNEKISFSKLRIWQTEEKFSNRSNNSKKDKKDKI